jgi:hypothetical protein
MRRVDRVREARTWAQVLGPYGTPKISRSVFELLITAVPFALLWGLMWAALGVGYVAMFVVGAADRLLSDAAFS